MSLIFDVPKHVLKPKSAPNVPTPKASTPNVPPPEIPTPEEISANEANISDAENFQNTLFENETPQTPPTSPDQSKQCKRKSTNKGKGTPKRSKQRRMVNLLS